MIAVFLHLVILTSDKIQRELFFCPIPTPFSTEGVVPALVTSYDMHGRGSIPYPTHKAPIILTSDKIQ